MAYDDMKRQEKEETAKRIKNMDDYYRQQILNKINQDSEKTKMFMTDKQVAMERRKQLRKETDQQKEQLLRNMEAMKKKGKFDPKLMGLSATPEPTSQNKTKSQKGGSSSQSPGYVSNQPLTNAPSQKKIDQYKPLPKKIQQKQPKSINIL